MIRKAWGPFLTSPLGDNFHPKGEVVPQGWILSSGVKLFPGGEIFCRECSPLGVNEGVNEGVNIPPRGQFSPLGAKGEVKNGPLFAKVVHIYLHT
jgi:hypothetical protein